jgi:hypothetical protein
MPAAHVRVNVTFTKNAVPSSPQNLKAASSNGQIVLSWSAPLSNGGSPIIEYQVSNNNGSSWVKASSTTWHIFSGLTNGKLYTFLVRAINLVGNGNQAVITAAPSDGTTVTITWDPNGDDAWVSLGRNIVGNSETMKIGEAINPSQGRAEKLPVPKKLGYIFGGWWTVPGSTGGSQILPTTKVPTVNTTYYARWTKPNLSIQRMKASIEANYIKNTLCAEFVSDCLMAGGIYVPYTEGAKYASEYYPSNTVRTLLKNGAILSSWRHPYIASPALLIYLSETGYEVLPEGKFELSQMSVGDVVFMYGDGGNYDAHVVIITEIKDSIPIYTAHNSNTREGRFGDTEKSKARFLVKMRGF